jgi:hypothetical protein
VQALMAKLEIQPTLLERIRIAQEQDDETIGLHRRSVKVWDFISHQMGCSGIKIDFVYLTRKR